MADAAPGAGQPALRILRNVVEDFEVGKLRTELAGLVESVVDATGDPLDGTSLLIGDLDGDGAAEYIVTRSVPVGTDTQTRTMTTDN